MGSVVAALPHGGDAVEEGYLAGSAVAAASGLIAVETAETVGIAGIGAVVMYRPAIAVMRCVRAASLSGPPRGTVHTRWDG